VNVTKLAPLVLICFTTLAVVSGIGFALSSGVSQRMEATVPKNNTEVNRVADALTLGYHVLGDPIDVPRPN